MVGAKAGRQPIVSEEDKEFLVQLAVRADRANQGLTSKELSQNLQQLTETSSRPLSKEQSNNFVYKTLRKDDRVKSNLITAQKTTSKRSMSSVGQQFRWMKNFIEALDYLRRENTGLCKKTGKTFGEVIDYFVVGADETCLMSDSNGNVRIVAAASKRKHERLTSDHRCSITMFRSGVTVGGNGPTGFLLKGKKKRPGYTDDMLVKHGCEPGSTIIMTENAFMTNEAWIELTRKALGLVCPKPCCMSHLTIVFCYCVGGGWVSSARYY
jgi:hypothetical protein